MLGYVKICYKTKEVNTPLKKCIMYIGKHYGKDNSNLFESGVTYLAKHVKGASKTSIRKMVYPNTVKGSEMMQWSFKKYSYERAYRYIIYKMLYSIEHRQEALDLLKMLYLEARATEDIPKIVSEILVREQQDTLSFAIDKPQYTAHQIVIEKILQAYKKCDKVYGRYII